MEEGCIKEDSTSRYIWEGCIREGNEDVSAKEVLCIPKEIFEIFLNEKNILEIIIK